MLPMDPVMVDIPPDSFRFSTYFSLKKSKLFLKRFFSGTPDARLEYPYPRGGRYAKNFTYSLEFRTDVSDGIIFFVGSDTGAHYVLVYLRNGQVIFGYNTTRGVMFQNLAFRLFLLFIAATLPVL